MNTENQKSSSETPSGQGGVISGFYKLVWEELDSHFGKSWIAQIPGFRSCYCVWIDRNSGNTIVSDLKSEKSIHFSIMDAKKWCQENFEITINKLIHETN
jgi:hypothetical protein